MFLLITQNTRLNKWVKNNYIFILKKLSYTLPMIYIFVERHMIDYDYGMISLHYSILYNTKILFL